MFNKISINRIFDVRKEEEQVLFFSGNTRSLHFISTDAFKILEMACEKSFKDLTCDLCEDDEDKDTLKVFFEDLKSKSIILYE